jgi:hypothetical protein
MRRLLAACAIAVSLVATPVSAQQQDSQVLLAEAAIWSRDFSAIMQQAAEPLVGIDTFVQQIMDRFEAGRIDAERAAAEVEAWRVDSLAKVARARAAAESLRAPPSSAHLGPDGVRLDTAFAASRDSAAPLVHEFERVIIALADFGVSAVRDPSKAQDARQRAVLNAAMQLLRVDLNRIDAAAASLSTEHPHQAVQVATQHYYNASIAMITYALAALDDGGDRTAVIATLRSESSAMRRELDRARILAARTIETLPAQLAGAPPEFVEAAMQAFRTYPDTIRAFSGLADGVDVAAASLQRGAHPLDVWADQEVSDRPYLDELERLDAVRQEIMANNNRRAL